MFSGSHQGRWSQSFCLVFVVVFHGSEPPQTTERHFRPSPIPKLGAVDAGRGSITGAENIKRRGGENPNTRCSESISRNPSCKCSVIVLESPAPWVGLVTKTSSYVVATLKRRDSERREPSSLAMLAHAYRARSPQTSSPLTSPAPVLLGVRLTPLQTPL